MTGKFYGLHPISIFLVQRVGWMGKGDSYEQRILYCWMGMLIHDNRESCRMQKSQFLDLAHIGVHLWAHSPFYSDFLLSQDYGMKPLNHYPPSVSPERHDQGGFFFF